MLKLILSLLSSDQLNLATTIVNTGPVATKLDNIHVPTSENILK